MARHVQSAELTVVGHAHGQALLEAAVLAFVAVLFLDFAAALTPVVLQLQADGPPKETLEGKKIKKLLMVLIKIKKIQEIIFSSKKKKEANLEKAKKNK